MDKCVDYEDEIDRREFAALERGKSQQVTIPDDRIDDFVAAKKLRDFLDLG